LTRALTDVALLRQIPNTFRQLDPSVTYYIAYSNLHPTIYIHTCTDVVLLPRSVL